MINVMICDDLVDIRTHFSGIINAQEDMCVVCSAATKDEAVILAKEHKPDIILMDIQMDTSKAGIDATKEITKFLPDVKIIMFTIHNDDDLIVEAYLSGAVDYMIKETEPDKLCDTIRKIYQSTDFIGPLLAATVKDNIKKSQASILYMTTHFFKLTQTEKEILWLLYQKYSRRKIAEMRFSSEETIKIHIKHILRKLNFSNVAEMLIFLREIGIMELLEKQQQMFDKKE